MYWTSVRLHILNFFKKFKNETLKSNPVCCQLMRCFQHTDEPQYHQLVLQPHVNRRAFICNNFASFLSLTVSLTIFAVKFALFRISISLYKITMTTNPLLDDIRYKEGLVCMNKGMFEGAIDLFCSLAEEWWVDAISAHSIDNGIYWFYCACCAKWLWCA